MGCGDGVRLRAGERRSLRRPSGERRPGERDRLPSAFCRSLWRWGTFTVDPVVRFFADSVERLAAVIGTGLAPSLLEGVGESFAFLTTECSPSAWVGFLGSVRRVLDACDVRDEERFLFLSDSRPSSSACWAGASSEFVNMSLAGSYM